MEDVFCHPESGNENCTKVFIEINIDTVTKCLEIFTHRSDSVKLLKNIEKISSVTRFIRKYLSGN